MFNFHIQIHFIMAKVMRIPVRVGERLFLNCSVSMKVVAQSRVHIHTGNMFHISVVLSLTSILLFKVLNKIFFALKPCF